MTVSTSDLTTGSVTGSASGPVSGSVTTATADGMRRAVSEAPYGAWASWAWPVKRLVVALALATALAVSLAFVTPAAAHAAGQPGYCPDATGVTVVVDFQGLGGGVVVRCAPAPLPGSGTGLDALVAAGIPLEGTRRWGDSFVCRLVGKPAVTTSLAVTGQPAYHEQCLDTPPSAAFWGYWHASNGGSWQYSQQGVKSHQALPGGFEGWSFSLNASGSGNPVPRLTPARPDAPVSPSPATRPGTGSGAGSSSVAGGSGPAGASPSATTGDTARPGSTGSAPPGSAPTATTSAPGGPPTSGAARATTTAPGATPSPTVPPTQPPVVSGQLASAPVASSGPSTGTVVGIGMLAFLVVAGAGTAWRRRRGADSS